MLRAVLRGLGLMVLSLAWVGCGDGATSAEPGWTVTIEGDAVEVVMFVRAGGCDGAAEWESAYAVSVPSSDRPPSLAPGTYGVGGYAYGRLCDVVACGCQEVSFPLTSDLETVLPVLTDACPTPAPAFDICAPPDRGLCGAGDGCVFNDDPDCASGQFLGLDGQCRDRIRPVWPDPEQCPPPVPARERSVMDCAMTFADVRREFVDLANAGGGTLNLGPCTFTHDQPTVALPLTTRDAPIVLQGSGVGETILVSTDCTDPGCAPLVRALRGANLIVRDLTLRAEAAGQGGIGLSGGDGTEEDASAFVLIEDVEIISDGTGISFDRGRDFTARRVEVTSGEEGLQMTGDPLTADESERVTRVAVLGSRFTAMPGTGQRGMRILGVGSAEINDVQISGYEEGWAVLNGNQDVLLHDLQVRDCGPARIGNCGMDCGSHERVVLQDSDIQTTDHPALFVDAQGAGETWLLHNEPLTLDVGPGDTVRTCIGDQVSVNGDAVQPVPCSRACVQPN